MARLHVSEHAVNGAIAECSNEELQELRDRYEGKLTASLYTGVLTVAVIATLSALVTLLFLYYVSIEWKETIHVFIFFFIY